MLEEELNWTTAAVPRLMKRLRQGRYEGICSKTKKRVRIDLVNGKWELYLDQEFLGSWPLKRTALQKANALLTSEMCDEYKQ